jgi:hypothetical protein
MSALGSPLVLKTHLAGDCSSLCRTVAVLGVIIGAILLFQGYALSKSLIDPNHQWWPEALTKNGIILLLAAIVLGTLADISYSVRKWSSDSRFTPARRSPAAAHRGDVPSPIQGHRSQ